MCPSRLRTLHPRQAISHLLLWGMLLSGASSVEATTLRLRVVDARTDEPVGARVYLENAQGQAFYFEPENDEGTAVSYDKQNWINERSIERHTTVSPHPMRVDLPEGEYRLTVERGPHYLPYRETLEIGATPIDTRVSLVRFFDPASNGWYSGDTHLHRTVEELKTVLPAEDLNVGLPLTYWVTRGEIAPTAGDRNQEDVPAGLIEIDAKHVIWPRNTEYEIFTVRQKPHTLGALFVLGHREPLELGVPPWRPVVRAALEANPEVVFDMDKLDWPFAMLLPTIAPGALYELANNHMWRTEFAFREWNTAAPTYMRPPAGTSMGGHRAWLDYTLEMYYALLNCGLELPVTGGTANGVHPVPAGFGRVYVHLPNGFRYDDWMRGLKAGQSYVTTGPLLTATVADEVPGKRFEATIEGTPFSWRAAVYSQQPLSYGELVVNGRPTQLLRPTNTRQADGSYRSEFTGIWSPETSGWCCLRFFEHRPDGQTRFVHSAPWYVRIAGKPLEMPRYQRDYLVQRMRAEIDRSRDLLPSAAIDEYQQAIDYYASRPVVDDSTEVAMEARPSQGAELDAWLDNMILDHQYSAHEVRAATGLSLETAERAIEVRRSADHTTMPDEKHATNDRTVSSQQEVRLRPYPGGRHPRGGFLEGAVRPQRETKVSLFPGWDDGGYVVVDVPEAVFSNLGLTYLAHTHIPTIWDERGEQLERLEWRGDEQHLELLRELPGGIAYHAEVDRTQDGARMRMRLTNGTSESLTGLRVQMCCMLKALRGFSQQDPLETRTNGPAIAVRGEHPKRWVMMAWSPNHRVWTNPPVPCFHSDPIFPDCEPGATVEVRGGVWFYEGDDIDAKLREIAAELESQLER